MSLDQLDNFAQQLRNMVRPIALKTEVDVSRAKSLNDPSTISISIWTEARGQAKYLRQLIKAFTLPDWKCTKIQQKTLKDRFLWKATVHAEFIQSKGKPLAVRLAEQGRPGQEKNPSYVR